jgi:hypothetical protein
MTVEKLSRVLLGKSYKMASEEERRLLYEESVRRDISPEAENLDLADLEKVSGVVFREPG